MSRSPGRELAIAVGACAAGAAAALLGASRAWTVTLTPRPQPLPPLHVAHSGGALLPWLPALALVGLAGAGALLATRERVRVAAGVVIALAGVGVVAGGLAGFRYTAGWPLLAVAGGLTITWCGVQTIRRGRSWPAMSARYERPSSKRTPSELVDRPVTGMSQSVTGMSQSVTDMSMWDDLDRGVDPTAPG